MLHAPDDAGYLLPMTQGYVFAEGSGTAHAYGHVEQLEFGRVIVGAAMVPSGSGYHLDDNKGRVYSFGPGATFHGDVSSTLVDLRAPIVDIVMAPTGDGYTLVDAEGWLYPFGPGAVRVDRSDLTLASGVVAAAFDPARKAFWLLDGAGAVQVVGPTFSFGSAHTVSTSGGRAVLTFTSHVPGPTSVTVEVPAGSPPPKTTTIDWQPRVGYWMVGRDGGVFAFGDATYLGGAPGFKAASSPFPTHEQPPPPPGPAVAMAAAPGSTGYWIASSKGAVLNARGVDHFGSALGVASHPIVGIAATPTGKGYWLVASDAGVFAFGDAPFRGSTGHIRLNQPIVGMAAMPSGNGYWLVASDGGIFAFGDAAFRGSTGNIRLNQPVVGMASTSTGAGYWMVASDGGIFAFGDAAFRGSTGNIRLNQPVVGMARAPSGAGYWMVARDGGILAFGDAPFLGSLGGVALQEPIVGMAALL